MSTTTVDLHVVRSDVTFRVIMLMSDIKAWHILTHLVILDVVLCLQLTMSSPRSRDCAGMANAGEVTPELLLDAASHPSMMKAHLPCRHLTLMLHTQQSQTAAVRRQKDAPHFGPLLA
jgi:hypothetical protein